MSDPSTPVISAPADSRRYLPWMLLLFVGSGCAALIYEIVWFQMLQLVIGSTAVSLGVLLATFMGGMCLGSLLLPRILSPKHRPLRVYALLELSIGIIGLAVLFGIPWLERAYLAHATPGMSSIMLRGLVCAGCLLPPTLLMGATLPAISRQLESTPMGVSWLGFFYGGNIAGAVFGCLLAGFYLLRVHDMTVATCVAALVNFSVSMLGLGLDSQLPRDEPEPVTEPEPAPAPAADASLSRKLVYLVIGLSGLTALGAEVVWTRLLSLLLGGTVYTFSVILAVFLTGLGIGSSVGSWWARITTRPRMALGICQLLLAASIAWPAYMIADSLPYWPINLELVAPVTPAAANMPWFAFQLDLARCLWALLPPTLFWGASFPLALAAAAERGQDPGKLVGGVYAANTVGAILGSLWFSLYAIPHWGLTSAGGTQMAERLLICIALAAAILMLGPDLLSEFDNESPAHAKNSGVVLTLRAFAFTVACCFVAVLAFKVDKIPDGVIGYGRSFLQNISAEDMAQKDPAKRAIKFLYVGEGLNSSVAVSQQSNGDLYFHVSGKVEASTSFQDMRLQRMLGHFPALMQKEPKSVLIVGCGAGVTAGTFTQYPSIQRIVICEIEPLIPVHVTPWFGEQNYHIVDNIAQENPHQVNGKQVEVVYDDGRHFMLTTKEKFDIITSDPIHPWVKGSAVLYTKEYFELCKEHLNPGGMVTQWVPLYESTPATVQSELKTFFSVFPQGMLWSNDENGEGYDAIVMGEATPGPINVDQMQARLDRPDYAPVMQSLADVGFHSALDMMETYGASGGDLANWLRDADLNTDRDLRLQYLAGFGANVYLEKQIYDDIKNYRTWPAGLFTGSPADLQALRSAIAPPPDLHNLGQLIHPPADDAPAASGDSP
jgi:spermidine synthase